MVALVVVVAAVVVIVGDVVVAAVVVVVDGVVVAGAVVVVEVESSPQAATNRTKATPRHRRFTKSSLPP